MLSGRPKSCSGALALFALRFYKAYLSLLFAGNCRFEPTCSRYSYEAIETIWSGAGIVADVEAVGALSAVFRKVWI